MKTKYLFIIILFASCKKSLQENSVGSNQTPITNTSVNDQLIANRKAQSDSVIGRINYFWNQSKGNVQQVATIEAKSILDTAIQKSFMTVYSFTNNDAFDKDIIAKISNNQYHSEKFKLLLKNSYSQFMSLANSYCNEGNGDTVLFKQKFPAS